MVRTRRFVGSCGLAVAMMVAATPVVHAQSAADVDATLNTLFGTHEPYREFLLKLQAAVAADDRAAVAAMVEYPFRGRIGGKAVTVRDAGHFVADYDRILTPGVRQAIARQKYETLFANWQGVSIGDGEVWFSGVGAGDAIRIIAIND